MTIGQRVRVHFNLHTYLWSVTAMDGPDRGRVIAHQSECALIRCKFIVSEAGRQRVLRNRCRLVHAWVEGFVTPLDEPLDAAEFSYNPYRDSTFTRRDTGAALHTASRVWFIGCRALVSTD
jgi:hypothetical protein